MEGGSGITKSSLPQVAEALTMQLVVLKLRHLLLNFLDIILLQFFFQNGIHMLAPEIFLNTTHLFNLFKTM